MSLPRAGRNSCDVDELFRLCWKVLLLRRLLLLLLLSPMPSLTAGLFVASETSVDDDDDGTAEPRFDLDGVSPRAFCGLPLAFALGLSSRGTYPGG